jgi:hypothetical protein
MTATHQLTQTAAPKNRARRLTIHVAGLGLFVVMRGSLELFCGTFEQCYDYVNEALQGPRAALTC